MDQVVSPNPHESIAATWQAILCALLAAIGGFGLGAAQGVALYRRVSLIRVRIERMMVRFRAGKLWRVSGRAPAGDGAIHKRIDTLPRRFGWLVIAGGHRAAGFGSQIHTVLNTPEMAELLAASPQAVRVLRPLCRALAIEIPGEVAEPRERKVRRVRERKPRPKPEPFRIPLPRGVLTAARRQGFGKLC
jgi:hypothetical protein